VRDEIEAREKLVGALREMIGVLDEHGPVAARQLLEARRREGPMLEGVRRSAPPHEARGRVGVPGEREHFARRERVGEARKRGPDEQRLALPMAKHERFDIEAADETSRVLACH